MVTKEPVAVHHKHSAACEFCGTFTAYRSHRRNVFEYLRTHLTGKVPFRCRTCKRRFWRVIDPQNI